MRKSSKNKIDYCPKCGRRGRVRKYANGGKCFIHKSTYKGVAYETVDNCYIEPPETD